MIKLVFSGFFFHEIEVWRLTFSRTTVQRRLEGPRVGQAKCSTIPEDPKMEPKWIENGPKIDKKSNEKINTDFLRFWIRFLMIFEPRMKPNCDKNWK